MICSYRVSDGRRDQRVHRVWWSWWEDPDPVAQSSVHLQSENLEPQYTDKTHILKIVEYNSYLRLFKSDKHSSRQNPPTFLREVQQHMNMGFMNHCEVCQSSVLHHTILTPVTLGFVRVDNLCCRHQDFSSMFVSTGCVNPSQQQGFLLHTQSIFDIFLQIYSLHLSLWRG